MKLWKFLTLVFVLALLAPKAMAQGVSNYISWTQSTKKISDTEVDVIFTAKIGSGWHLYGTEIADGGPTPTHLVVDKLVGGKLVGKLKGNKTPISKQDPFFEMQISYWESGVTLHQRIKVEDASKFHFEGALRYMICNDEKCMPPSSEEFKYSAKDFGLSAKSIATTEEVKPEAEKVSEQPTTDTLEQVSTPTPSAVDTAVNSSNNNLWAPVIKELKSFDGDHTESSPWMIFVYGFLGGLVALITPCVWPMIPMTVSFFLKRTKDRSKSIRDALVYGLSIILIYLTLGLVITAIFGAGGLNKFATSAGFNIAFFLILVFFSISFFGAFEIVLPASWTNKMDQKADSTTG